MYLTNILHIYENERDQPEELHHSSAERRNDNHFLRMTASYIRIPLLIRWKVQFPPRLKPLRGTRCWIVKKKKKPAYSDSRWRNIDSAWCMQDDVKPCEIIAWDRIYVYIHYLGCKCNHCCLMTFFYGRKHWVPNNVMRKPFLYR